ncbi:MAG: DUF456 domain-containing protein [Acidimicrobiia bacterium]|nr:DUF456 domain-containing protein [Acidimicrobiia bacterium]
MSDGWATVLVAVVMVVGLAGTIVPVLPGLAVVWGATLVYGLLVGFDVVGASIVAVSSLLLLASAVTGFVIPKRSADGADVGRWSQLIALVAAIVGFFVVPVVGLVLGALIGLFLAEYANHRTAAAAWTATVAVAKGFGLSALVDLALGVVMITLWGAWALTVLW